MSKLKGQNEERTRRRNTRKYVEQNSDTTTERDFGDWKCLNLLKPTFKSALFLFSSGDQLHAMESM